MGVISAGFGAGAVSAMTGAVAAGTVMMTLLPSADASMVPAWLRWRLTRVRREPISVTSSTETEPTDGGSADGMARDAAFDAPVRSMTNRSGIGLHEL